MSKKKLSIRVANQPGVLSRVAQVFSRRGFNIESLDVTPLPKSTVSVMTLIAHAPESLDRSDTPKSVAQLDALWSQIMKQTKKLIDVIDCDSHDTE